MITRSEFGHPFAAANLVITLAQLKALSVDDNVNGEEIFVGVNRYYYNSTSVLAGDDMFVVAPTTGLGRYLLSPGSSFDLPVAIDFNKADAAVLYTLPTGSQVVFGGSYWEIATDWTGGSSSAIGLSSSSGTASTKGDLLGGASGDVAAALTAALGITGGTPGAKAGRAFAKATHTVRFDRVTSAFTAGTGFAHIVGTVLKNAGA